MTTGESVTDVSTTLTVESAANALDYIHVTVGGLRYDSANFVYSFNPQVDGHAWDALETHLTVLCHV